MSQYVASEWGTSSWAESDWGQAGYLKDRIILSWEPSPSPDVDYYTVKFSPDAFATWDDAIEVYRSPSFLFTGTESFSCSVEAKFGVFLCAATDTSGNTGESAKIVYGDIDGWNLVFSAEPHPEFAGKKVNCMAISTGHLLLTPSAPTVDGAQLASCDYVQKYTAAENERVRIITDRIIFESGSMYENRGEYEISHQWRNAQTGVTEWQDFSDEIVTVSGVVEFRIKLINFTPEHYLLVKEAEILVYREDI